MLCINQRNNLLLKTCLRNSRHSDIYSKIVKNGQYQLITRKSRSYSTDNSPTKTLTVEAARDLGLKMLSQQDRSSFILHKYIPKRAQDTFLALQMFALDTAKIGDTVKHQEFAKLRFDFWKRVIQQIFNVTAQDPSQNSQPNSMFSGALTQEPIAILLIHALSTQNIQLSKRYFITYLQSRETYSRMPPFRNLDAMASYGEGLNSQLLYLLQEALYSVAPKVSAFLAEYPEVDKIAHDIVAHIGQASGIAALLKGSIYYAQRGSLVFPIDVMAKYDLSQSDVNDLFEAHFAKQAQEGSNDEKINQLRTKLSDVVFETATRANDHLLSATSLLNQLKTALEGDVPDALIVPALSALPAKLYLEDLEAYNFDILNPKLLAPSRASKLFGVVGDWKLPYRSYKAYKNKSLD